MNGKTKAQLVIELDAALEKIKNLEDRIARLTEVRESLADALLIVNGLKDSPDITPEQP